MTKHNFRGATCVDCGYVDLTAVLGPDCFDNILRAVERVVESSESLSLDSAEDRETLKQKLYLAVGAVDKNEVRVGPHGCPHPYLASEGALR